MADRRSPTNPPAEIGVLVGALARDAARAQMIFDEADEDAQDAFVELLSKVPEEARPDLLPLAPKRMRIARMDVECRVNLGVRREVGFYIGARILNLSADLRYQETDGGESRLKITVEQVPAGDVP